MSQTTPITHESRSTIIHSYKKHRPLVVAHQYQPDTTPSLDYHGSWRIARGIGLAFRSSCDRCPTANSASIRSVFCVLTFIMVVLSCHAFTSDNTPFGRLMMLAG